MKLCLLYAGAYHDIFILHCVSDLHGSLPTELTDLIIEQGFDYLPELIRILLNAAMQAERQQHLGVEPYERSSKRQGYANGFKQKMMKTRLGEISLDVPQVRDGSFYPDALEKGLRSERALTLALAEMYVQGVSTRRVKSIVEQLCGTTISSSQVSRAAAQLDETLEAWRNRVLGVIRYLYLDARYEKVRVDGQIRDAAILIASGVSADGKRQILGLSVSLSEQEIHWRSFLQSLLKRGLRGVQLIISDAHTGLQAARQAVFGSIPWQRCQYHLQQNVQAYVPRRALQREVAQDLRNIFHAPDLATAQTWLNEMVEKYQPRSARLANWLEQNVPDGLTIFSFPSSHRRRIRTVNMLERVSQEVKRRTRVVRIFPNEEACLRLISAILMEISEDWQTGRIYLSFEGADSISQS